VVIPQPYLSLAKLMNNLFEVVVARIRDDAASGVLPAFLKTAQIVPSTTLEELGLDSLGRMTLLATLEDLTDQYIPESAFNDAQTLGQIIDMANDMDRSEKPNPPSSV
jgi:acyl carrier protein